jgi:YhcH/YjgK/YiaL family protein
MIIDRLENSGTYTGLGRGIDSALNFLKTTDLEKAGEGRHDIDGDAVYALVMDYTTKPASEGVWEAHRRYIDVQYVVSGVERIGYTHLDTLAAEPYNEEGDYLFLKGSGDFVLLPTGTFIILWPQDAHIPGTSVDQPSPVRKVVIKVQLNN